MSDKISENNSENSSENIEEIDSENLPENILKKDFEEVYEIGLDNLKESMDAFADIHDQYVKDIKFGLLGLQWDDSAQSARKLQNRTCKTYNKLVSNIRYVVNLNMRTPPAIKVHPISEGTKEVAEIYDGLVRHIENESNSNDLRSGAFQNSVAGGLGVWKICTKMSEEYPGQYELYEEAILNPTTVYPDPEAIDPTMADAKWLFQVKELSVKKFKKLFPEAETTSIKDNLEDWFKKDYITIAEYWRKNDDGTVSWYILNGNEILDSSEKKEIPYPGKYIPFVFVLGEDIIIDGTRTIKSIIRDSIDYQTTLNYMESEAIDYVQKAAKTPWIMSDKALGPYKLMWDTANTANWPYMLYAAGNDEPHQIQAPASPIGYLEAVSDLSNSIKETVGIKDTFEDIPAGSSGKAIQLQMAQSNIGTYVWTDHLNRAIKHAGKIIVDLIPHYYSHEHIQQILGIDGSIKNVKFGGLDGIDLMGKYSVTISTGASYEDQRSETNENMLELFKMDPEMIKVFGDMFVRNMDFPESNQMADRLQVTMDPKIINAGNQTGDIKSQFQQLLSQNQNDQMQIEKLTQVLQAKTQEVQMLEQKLEDKLSTEQLRSQTEIHKNQIDNATEIKVAQIKGEYDLRMKAMEKQLEELKLLFAKPEGPKNIHVSKTDVNVIPTHAPENHLHLGIGL